MKRGEVWLTDFGEPSSPEQAGLRPAIVMQDDVLNDSMVTVILIPLTTNVRRLALPTTVLIPVGEAGLDRDSVALCHQIQVRGKVRLRERLGELSADRFGEVCERLLDTLGL